MRLRDWKFDAEQYRDIDRAAQAEAEAAIETEKRAEAAKNQPKEKPKK